MRPYPEHQHCFYENNHTKIKECVICKFSYDDIIKMAMGYRGTEQLLYIATNAMVGQLFANANKLHEIKGASKKQFIESCFNLAEDMIEEHKRREEKQNGESHISESNLNVPEVPEAV